MNYGEILLKLLREKINLATVNGKDEVSYFRYMQI